MNFWTPRNFKFGINTNHLKPLSKNAKLEQKRSGKSHVRYFSNFGTPSISPERMKLETSNLARIWPKLRGGLTMKCKIRLKVLVKVSRDLLIEYLDPSTYREWLKLETSNLARSMLITRGTDEKNANVGLRQRGFRKRSGYWP